ncbi:MAG: hypothetical protein J0M36_07855 [Caulobacterales bacterium]|nr:hypothetical protein [Caulobacterales bacterium]
MTGRRVALHGQGYGNGSRWTDTLGELGCTARALDLRVVMVDGDPADMAPGRGMKRLLGRLAKDEVDVILTELDGQAVAIALPDASLFGGCLGEKGQ